MCTFHQTAPLRYSKILDMIASCPHILDQSREVIVMGDFNPPNCTWTTHGTMNSGVNTSKGKLLDNFMANLLLTQKIQVPTREKNILDLVLTNNTLLSDITVMPTIHSDHNLIKMSTDLQLREPV